MIRVVVADDQEIVRDGLVTLIGLLDGIEVAGDAADGAAAVDLVAAERPDVVLMDLRMPGVDGVEATRRIAADHPGTAVLVLTTFADDESIVSALRAGARGYLTKDAGRAQLEAAVRAVASGQTSLSGDVGARVVAGLLAPTPTPATGATAGDAATRGAEGSGGEAAAAADAPAVALRERFPELTPREADVLALIADGRANPTIAAELYISVATVKTHVNAIFAKLGTPTRAELMALVARGRR